MRTYNIVLRGSRIRNIHGDMAYVLVSNKHGTTPPHFYKRLPQSLEWNEINPKISYLMKQFIFEIGKGVLKIYSKLRQLDGPPSFRGLSGLKQCPLSRGRSLLFTVVQIVPIVTAESIKRNKSIIMREI